MRRPDYDERDTLVTLLKEPKDWEIVQSHGIYRIRGSLRHPPTILSERRVRLLGFYLPSKFGRHRYSVRHCARVRRISMAPRRECVPGEPPNARSEELYYKFELEPPTELAEPILSLRKRSHMVLIPTTEQKLLEAPELNFLYQGTRLEEKMWAELVQNNILAEREYPVHTRNERAYLLDFAIFCRKGRFAIEVDGPHHQATPEKVIADNHRDNDLGVEDWTVFRYVPADLDPPQLGTTMQQVCDKIAGLGGLDTLNGLLPQKPAGATATSQLSLFREEHLNFLNWRRRIKEKHGLG